MRRAYALPFVTALIGCGNFGATEAPSGQDAGDAAVADAGVMADPYEAAVLADQPLAYWRLSEPSCAKSECPSKVSAAYPALPPIGVVLVPGLFGEPSRAVAFSDTQGKPIVVNAMPFPSGTFTVEAWFRPSAAPDDRFRAIVSQCAASSNTPDSFILLYHGTYGLVFERRVSGSKPTKLSSDHPSKLTIGQWYHLVGIYDSAAQKVTIVVDGTAGELGTDLTQYSDKTPFAIGGNQDGTDAAFGSVAEVALYDRVLGADRIQQHITLGREKL